VEEARPYVEKAMRRLYFPKPDRQAVAFGLGALLDLTTTFPQRALRLLGRIERGDIGVAVRPEGMDSLMRDLNHMVNRLSVTISGSRVHRGASIGCFRLSRIPVARFFLLFPVCSWAGWRERVGTVDSGLNVQGRARALSGAATQRRMAPSARYTA